MKRYSTILVVIYFCLNTLLGQQDLRLGQWKSHLPQNQGWSVTQSPEKIIYGTPWSIIYIDKEELSASFLTKTDGLSDIGVSVVAYDPFNDQLFVAYESSDLDIIKDGEIINVPNIKSNTTISNDRRINDIHFVSSELAFIATGFGIIEYNPRAYNFGATSFTSVRVNQIASSSTYIYAATDDGVYRTSITSTDKADFNTWQLLETSVGLPSVYQSKAIVFHQESLYADIDGVLYKATSENLWTVFYEDTDGLDLVYLQDTDDRLISGWKGSNFRGEVRFFSPDGFFISSDGSCANIVRGAIKDEQGRIWYAEGFTGIRSSKDYTSGCDIRTYNGPFAHQVSDIVIKEDQVLCASGGVSESFGFLFKREGMYHFQNRQWTNYNEFEEDRLKPLEALSIFRVALHPSLPKIYGGSYWAGLLEYDIDQDNYQLYNKTNSTLRGSSGDPQRERITGLAFDVDENLWVSTYNAAEPLNVMESDGNWKSFPVISPGTLSDVVIDDVGYKWCSVFGNSGGVLIYDSGNSIASKSDDRQRFLNAGNSELTTNLINTVAVDRTGAIWVGTSEGAVVFDCGEDALLSDCQGLRPRVIQDGIPAFLLADQDIRVIEIDGADNKWFGTRNGIFVQSPNGEDQIAVFTEDNSPLFDNEITALSFNESTGEMYIGTNKGMLSYRTTTTVGVRRHRKDQVYAFPNPVPPDYFGTIAIAGLVHNAFVKITDIDGKLVNELRAQGGQAIWDGKDLQKRNVRSGVYLVWSTETDTFDSPDAFVTKIMVVR